MDTRWHCCSCLLEKWRLLLVECVWCPAALFTWWRSVSYSNKNREATCIFHFDFLIQPFNTIFFSQLHSEIHVHCTFQWREPIDFLMNHVMEWYLLYSTFKDLFLKWLQVSKWQSKVVSSACPINGKIWTLRFFFSSILSFSWLSSVNFTHHDSHWQEWGLEGYQLWIVCQEEQSVNGFAETEEDNHSITNVMQLQFVKSALTVNPCVVCISLYCSSYNDIIN